MDDLTDRPAPPRPGEELDVGRLTRYLDAALPQITGDLHVQQFPAGFSNLTYLLTRGATELVLRRPPFGRKPASGHDMRREHTVLTALAGAFPQAPRPYLYCDDEEVIGAPFLVMERRRGLILRRDPPPGLELGPEQVRTLCRRLVDLHAELHALDPRALGLDDFGRPEGYVERQVRGWSERWRRARTDDAPDAGEVMRWLAAKMPRESPRAALIHNDFKLDNLVLDPDDPTRILGVLDWEMATVGDPLMDLGSSLGYWIERGDPPELRATRMMPTDLDGALTRRELAARYAERAGLAIDGFDFYYAFGLFRLAAIAQQIYYRYAHGQTRDPRFATLGPAVHALLRAAQAVSRCAADSVPPAQA